MRSSVFDKGTGATPFSQWGRAEFVARLGGEEHFDMNPGRSVGM